MIAGMDIVFERMKQHPEEFVESTKWHGILGKVLEVLDDDEAEALRVAARQAQRDWFQGAVMGVLAGTVIANTPKNYAISSNVTEDSYYGGSSVYEVFDRHLARKSEMGMKRAAMAQIQETSK
jgi:hypothetical protein